MSGLDKKSLDTNANWLSIIRDSGTGLQSGPLGLEKKQMAGAWASGMSMGKKEKVKKTKGKGIAEPSPNLPRPDRKPDEGANRPKEDRRPEGKKNPTKEISA